MPPIRSVTCDPNVLTIITSLASVGTSTLTRTMIPANVINKSTTTIEAWIKTNVFDVAFIKSGIRQCFVDIHIFQVNPTLIFTVMCSNDPIEPNWWVE